MLNNVLDRLQNVKKTGANQYEARCPSHDDSKSSLHVSTGAEGKVVLDCKAKCDPKNVVDALGLNMQDLFPKTNVVYKKNIEYIYTDENGSPLLKIARTPDKKFPQSYFNNGKWISGGGDKENRVPYKLPELIKLFAGGGVVYIVEGEKDVETCMKKGLHSTCNPMGAGKWLPQYNKYFNNNIDVIIISDNDSLNKSKISQAGLLHAQNIYKNLNGIVKSCKIIMFDEVKDISDYFALGKTVEDLENYIENYELPSQLIETTTGILETTKKVKAVAPDDLGMYESEEGYKKLCWDKKEKETYIVHVSPFTIEPIETIRCDENTEQKVNIHYQNKTFETVLFIGDMSTPKAFRESIAKKISPNVWFNGSSNELTDILRLNEKKTVRTIQGVKCTGYHKYNNEWLYITPAGAINKNQDYISEVAILNRYKDIENGVILEENLISHDDGEKLAELLFNFNAEGVAGLLIGYCASLFIKERLYVELEQKFPNLTIVGGSGAGKSQTIESIIMPILSMKPNQQSSANQITNFTALKKVSSSNTAPYVINEYKPNKMPDFKKDIIDNIKNNCYDRYLGSRGQSTQEIVTYEHNAPVILIGESYDADTSANERDIKIYLVKHESEKHTEYFKKLKSYKELLQRLGKSLLIKGLEIDIETIKEYIKTNENLVNEFPLVTSRVKENVVITLVGLDMVASLLPIDNLAVLKLKAITRFIEDTMGGNSCSKSAIGEVLEYINQLSVEHEIESGEHFKIQEDKYLALDLHSIYTKILKHGKATGSNISLGQKEFSKMISKESYYVEYKPVKLRLFKEVEVGGKKIYQPVLRKCYILDIEILKKSELYLDSLLNLDTVSQE